MAASTSIQIAVTTLASVGGFIVGTIIAWTNPSRLAVLKGELGVEVNERQFAWMSGLLVFGIVIATIFYGFVVNRIGRKPTILLQTVPLVLGWLLLVWGNTVICMYLGRFILGLGVAALLVATPLYISEIAQKDIRGALGSIFQLMIAIGLLFQYCMGAVVHVVHMSVVSELAPLVFFVVFAFMPESPVYLVKADKLNKAERAFRFLRGQDYDYSKEIAEIKAVEVKNKSNNDSTCAALSRRATIKALVIAGGLLAFQQLGGFNVVILNSTRIFEIADTGLSPRVPTIILGAVQVVFTVVGTAVVDHVGRRLLLLVSSLAMGLSLIAVGAYLYIQIRYPSTAETIDWLPILSLVVYIMMYSIGYGPVPWLMLGEIFASDIKGVAAGIAITIGSVCCFLAILMFELIRENLGDGEAFWIYSAFNFLSALFVFFVVLETKGKSLNEIQEALEG